jgi:glycosyl-4,4'-diaponeurosporenoate acyltransferase
LLLELPLWAVAVADVAAWGAWSTAVGWWAWRQPPARFDHDSALTRLRPFEAGGRWYERRLAIRRWKDRMPEAGDLFPGGTSKRSLPGRDRAGLERFAAETRRAELVHWVVPLAAVPMAAWNPPALEAAMVAYAVAANVPCLLIQRYNRARVEAVLSRRSA